VSEQEKSPPELPHEGPPYQGHGPRPYQPPQPVPPPVPPGWSTPAQQAAPYQPPAYRPQRSYGPVPAAASSGDGQTVQTVGYVMAGASLVMPILGLVGLILGIITATKPNRGGHGAAIICLSLVLGVLAAVFWTGVYEDGSY
jgi:hypothetical protein